MAVILLDTSVASLLLPHKTLRPELLLYEPHLIDNTLALSFQSVGEIWKLAEKRRWGQQRRAELDAFLRRFVVIPYDYELARVWAWVCVEAERAGRRLETADAWITATAVHRRRPSRSLSASTWRNAAPRPARLSMCRVPPAARIVTGNGLVE